MEQLRESIEHLLHFTLNSHINSALDFDLGLSNTFCSSLLTYDPQDSLSPPTSTEPFQGVPRYPLYKRLASALYESIRRGSFYRTDDKKLFVKDEVSSRQKEDMWNNLIGENGSQLLNLMTNLFVEFCVRSPYPCPSKDGDFQTVEGSWEGDKDSIKQGTMVLVNKSVVLEVEDVRHYASFSEMLEAHSSMEFLPGVTNTSNGGALIYKKLYTEEKEVANGILSVYLSKPITQLYLPLARILSGLSYDGIQSLLGLGHTDGTVENALPPPRSLLLSSFSLPYKVNGSILTHGARALAKHADRSSSKYWGTLTGNESSKNRLAMDVISNLLTTCCWMNMHIVPPHGAVFEIRVVDGYGARWSSDGTKFIGFLEPYMEDGHLKGWKH